MTYHSFRRKDFFVRRNRKTRRMQVDGGSPSGVGIPIRGLAFPSRHATDFWTKRWTASRARTGRRQFKDNSPRELADVPRHDKRALERPRGRSPMADMRRREFVALLGGAAAWPLAAGGEQGERIRRIGVLMPSAADDPEFQARITAFLQGLAQLGWL